MVKCSNCHQPISEFGCLNITCIKPMSADEIHKKAAILRKNTQIILDNLNKEHKMTREDAIRHCLNSLHDKKIELGDISANQFVGMLEALGLLKFEEKINKLFEITESNVYWPAASLYQPDTKNLLQFYQKYGVMRLEEWSEGLVLWLGGEIVWKSWNN